MDHGFGSATPSAFVAAPPAAGARLEGMPTLDSFNDNSNASDDRADLSTNDEAELATITDNAKLLQHVKTNLIRSNIRTVWRKEAAQKQNEWWDHERLRHGLKMSHKLAAKGQLGEKEYRRQCVLLRRCQQHVGN